MDTQYWWEASKTDLHARVTTTIEKIDEQQSYRREQNRKWMSMYENRGVTGLDSTNYVEQKSTRRLRINVVASCIDTLVSKIMTSQTRPVFHTQAGNYKMQQQGKKLTKFSDGQFHHLKLHKKNRVLGKDGCIFGTGFLKFYNDFWTDPKKPSMVAERVFPDEVLVDDQDGRYCAPRSMFQYKEVSRAVLMRKYPKFKETIRTSSLVRKDSNSRTEIDQPVSWMEGWHLPSTEGDQDGRHCIVLNNCTLVDERWTCTEFPILAWRWKLRVLGYYGMGVAEELDTIQDEIDYCCEQIQEYINLGSAALYVNKNSNISMEKLLSNVAMRVIKGEGEAPVVINLMGVPQQLIDHLLWLIQQAYQIVGITQMSATGLKPEGLDSGTAQREYKDTESQRFQEVSQSWDDMSVEETERMIDLAKDLDERGQGDYEVMVKGPYGTEIIRWKDVNLPRDRYILQVRPASALPLTPAARRQAVVDTLGAVPALQPYALKLLDFPDLEAITRRVNAPLDTLQYLIERMLYEDSEMDDLSDVVARAEPMMLPYAQQGIDMCVGEYFRAKNSGVPEERLELLRNFMNDLVDLQKSQQQAMAQQIMEQQAMMQAAQQPPMGGEALPVMPGAVPMGVTP